MSEFPNRPVCASANAEHPAPDGPFRLNEYLTNRAYGGLEEGGWWYDTVRFVACHGGARRENELARRPPAGPSPDRLGALHRMAGASHRAARRRGLPRDAAALRVKAAPSPSPFGPRARASRVALALRRRQEAEARPVSGRPVHRRRSPVMPQSRISPTGAAP